MKKTNILFLLHLPPPIHGSSVVGKAIHDSALINEAFDARYLNLLASSNVAETGKVSVRKLAGFVVLWFRLLVQIICKRPNLLYFALTATGAAFMRDVFLVLLLKLFRIKIVYHLHNKGFSQQQSVFIKNLYQFVFKGAKVILLSKHLYADISELVDERDVYVCPNGSQDQFIINNEEFLAEPSGKAERIIKEKTKILFLSNLIASKGVFVLLEACLLLKEKGLDFECNFVGGEGDIKALEFNAKVISMNLTDRVFYGGPKYGEEKQLVFAEADIFAFPTYFETFGIVLLEAMQHSLPIVSTYEGGIPDIVEEWVTGFLVSQQNAAELANKLELLLKNPALRKQMGAAGRKKYEQEFTLEIFEKRMVAIIQNALFSR